MKLKEFLCESDDLRKEILKSEDMNQLSELVDYLHKPIVKEFLKDGEFLFRGMNETEPYLFIKRAMRANRMPKDSGEMWHNLYNSALKVFGDNPKWRSNSLFVIKRRDIANNYGDINIVIPLDTPHYLSSEYVDDMFGNIEMQSLGFLRRVMSNAIYVRGGHAQVPPNVMKDLKGLIRSSNAWSTFEKACNIQIKTLLELLNYEGDVVKVAEKMSKDAMTYNDAFDSVITNAGLAISDRLYDTDYARSVFNISTSAIVDNAGTLNVDVKNIKSYKNESACALQLFDEIHFDSIKDDLLRLFTDWLKKFIRSSYELGDTVPKTEGEIMMSCKEYLLIDVKVMGNIVKRIRKVYDKGSIDYNQIPNLLVALSSAKNDDDILDIVIGRK